MFFRSVLARGLRPKGFRRIGARFLSREEKEDKLLKNDLDLTGINLDEIDQILTDGALEPLNEYYPNLQIHEAQRRPDNGHNLVVIQPWVSYANFGDITDPDLQLDECVSLGNTIKNWKVIGKKVLFAKSLNRKHLVGPGSFERLKELIYSHPGVSAAFFGVELLSGIQLSSLERDLNMPVYDRFTMVLNIFRQHARTKEAKIQIALAELPYIRSHLREIHESSENSSASESLKLLVGGISDKFYIHRVNILKRREAKLKILLSQIRKQRSLTKLKRQKTNVPTVSVVGYTNSGKTTLIKALTQDERLIPENQLFATLDVSAFAGYLPSCKNVFYIDTVGFLSRIPSLLIEAFSATLADVKASDLILHILDMSHPDHRIQHKTVMDSLRHLDTSKELLDNIVTVGNKCDLVDLDKLPKSLPKCDIAIAASSGTNINALAKVVDSRLVNSLSYNLYEMRVPNGGSQYAWLRKNTTITDCVPDESDPNFLICRANVSPIAIGRWKKLHGQCKLVKSREDSSDTRV